MNVVLFFVILLLLIDLSLFMLILSNQHLLALSLRGNKLKSSEIVVKVVAQFKSLRALWLNYNPMLKNV